MPLIDTEERIENGLDEIYFLRVSTGLEDEVIFDIPYFEPVDTCSEETTAAWG